MASLEVEIYFLSRRSFLEDERGGGGKFKGQPEWQLDGGGKELDRGAVSTGQGGELRRPRRLASQIMTINKSSQAQRTTNSFLFQLCGGIGSG